MKSFMRAALLLALVTASWSACWAEGEPLPNKHPSASLDWSVRFPSCRRDPKAWRAFSPYGLSLDPRLRQHPYFEKQRRESDRLWRQQDAVDLTWLDLDGDGWCDVITSAEAEPFKGRDGTPTLLQHARSIYVHRQSGFKPFVSAHVPSQLDGMSLVIYWNRRQKKAEFYLRWYQGGVVGGLSPDHDAFHFRHMVRTAFAGRKTGDIQSEMAFYAEAEPLMSQGLLSPALAKRIWLEETHRAGIELTYPYGE
jgi:hypothetical protein